MPTLLQIHTYQKIIIISIVLALPFALFYPATQATLWANSHNSSFGDLFFHYFTMVGEWPVITLGVLLTLIRNPKAGFIAGLCFLLEAALVNGTKMLIHTERPVMAVGLEQLHQVAGETIHRYRSFPSGHTTASVIGFGLLSLLYPRKGYEVIFAISAVLIGYSRLYLGQHYLHDVLSGAIIGLLILQLYILLTRKFLPGYLT